MFHTSQLNSLLIISIDGGYYGETRQIEMGGKRKRLVTALCGNTKCMKLDVRDENLDPRYEPEICNAAEEWQQKSLAEYIEIITYITENADYDRYSLL